MADPIEYAGPNSDADPGRLRNLGIASIVAASIGIVVCAKLMVRLLAQMHSAIPGVSESQLRGILQTQACVFAVMLLLLTLQLAGGVLLCRRDRRGVTVHQFYAVLQLLASIGLAWTSVQEILLSPASMLAFLGMIPGIIAATYALAVLIMFPPRFLGMRDDPSDTSSNDTLA